MAKPSCSSLPEFEGVRVRELIGRSARRTRGVAARAVVVVLAATLLSVPVLAHGGPGLNSEPVETPTWLFLLTGGGVIAVSFLLTSFVTDRATLEGYHERRLSVPGGETIRRWGGRLAAVVGVLGLAAIVVVGLNGPAAPNRNLAVLLVWVVWWAGFTASVYLVGNSWPALDPFRAVTDLLPAEGRVELPEWVGTWPSVAGLLLLIWLEVVSDVASDPGQLTAIVVAYAVVTVLGSLVLGRRVWVTQVDPIAHVFRVYGRVAPVQRTEDGLELVVPGAALATRRRDVATRRTRMGDEGPAAADGGSLATPSAAFAVSEVGFVVALLWVTSFDGFVATPLWRDVIVPISRAGVPPRLAYFGALLVGYAGFLAAYWWASKLVRRTGQTFLSTTTIAVAFAPALVPIAAGYHLAHYLPYFLRYVPSALGAAASPLAPPELLVLSMPGWVGYVGPAAVLLGHVLGVWVAHSRSFDLFTGKLQPIRSQYPFVVVMVVYTAVSLWLLSQPAVKIGVL
jgi:hypothetical protein